MASSYELCHLKCELNMLGARNLAEHSSGLFIRCYVSTGDGRCIRVDSREIPSSCCPYRNLLAMLECQGDADHVTKLLEKHGVVFEVRRRKAASLLGQFSRSKLVGRASVAWKEVMGSAEMSAERWITVDTGSSMPSSSKPPAVLVEMKILLSEKIEKTRGRATHTTRCVEECRCRHCEWNLEEEDMFALATAIIVAC